MIRRDPLFPKRSLGQNFMVDLNVIRRIINACDLKPKDIILEIGPGKGALTQPLSQCAQKVIAVEKDPRLAERLKRDFENTKVMIVCADILDYPFHALPKNTKIVGNLPYNIATPIIKKIIDHQKRFQTLFATVQLEYGQRIIAKPGTKSYGSFSCFVQYHADVKMLFKIKNTSFRPAPKVQSCFLHFDLGKKPRHTARDEDLLFKIIRSCFGQRRKTIQNSLSGAIAKEKIPRLLQTLQINPRLRAENLCLEDYIRISDAVSETV